MQYEHLNGAKRWGSKRRGAKTWILSVLVLFCLQAGGLGLPAAYADAASSDPESTDLDAPGLSAGERMEALLAQVEARRTTLESLRATFRERKESPLLLDAEEATGTFVFRTPDQARWTITEPGDTLIVVQGQEMLTWHRHLGVAERLDLGSRGERMLQFFGPGSSLKKLRRYFDVSFIRPGDVTQPYRLEMLPRGRRVARRVSGLILDIDRRQLMPVYVRFEEASGALTEYWFSDLESDVELDDALFDLQLPENVEMRETSIGKGGDTDREP